METPFSVLNHFRKKAMYAATDAARAIPPANVKRRVLFVLTNLYFDPAFILGSLKRSTFFLSDKCVRQIFSNEK
jgi:hypothetical protein